MVMFERNGKKNFDYFWWIFEEIYEIILGNIM